MLFVVVAVLLFISDVAPRPLIQMKDAYLFRPQIGGSIKIFKEVESWDEALEQCRSDGAVLASPITEELQKELRTLFNKTSYFIGVDARFYHNKFVSVEGVPLDAMPVADMYDRLDRDDGQCLSMDHRNIRVVQCTSRMPYVCYKNQTDVLNITANSGCEGIQTVHVNVQVECEANGYKFEPSTKSCYKYHKEQKPWSDAQATCVAEGGHLAIPNDYNEATLLPKYITDKGTYAWIGLHIMTADGFWTSILGEPVNQHLQWDGKPSALGTCGLIHPSNPTLWGLMCGGALHFICEKQMRIQI